MNKIIKFNLKYCIFVFMPLAVLGMSTAHWTIDELDLAMYPFEESSIAETIVVLGTYYLFIGPVAALYIKICTRCERKDKKHAKELSDSLE